jgi:hypothetical protein
VLSYRESAALGAGLGLQWYGQLGVTPLSPFSRCAAGKFPTLMLIRKRSSRDKSQFANYAMGLAV